MHIRAYCNCCHCYREIPVGKLCPVCDNVLDLSRTVGLDDETPTPVGWDPERKETIYDDETPTPVDWGLEWKETIHHDKPKTGTESSSVPAPKSVLSDEEFNKLVAPHSMPSLADIYKKGLKQNVLRPVAAYAHKN